MIPQTIHYCWFGKKPLPKEVLRCIASWKKYFPDCEIKEWNEDKFDINIIPFTQEAYSVKKYAYVSDFARLWILYNYGGIYFDTDVEVIRDMTSIINRGPFMGIEKNTSIANLAVNPGIGFSASKGNWILQDVMKYYENEHYITETGIKQIPIVPITTAVLIRYGFNCKNEMQQVGDFIIYPYDYFCPIEYPLGKLEITLNTVSIHHYTESWMSLTDKIKMRFFAFLGTKHGLVLKKGLKKIIRR
jgi:mannosyltransferase OCH1-like enzyme